MINCNLNFGVEQKPNLRIVPFFTQINVSFFPQIIKQLLKYIHIAHDTSFPSHLFLQVVC